MEVLRSAITSSRSECTPCKQVIMRRISKEVIVIVVYGKDRQEHLLISK